MRLSAVEIKPDADGHAVFITGKNAAGKTSAVDSIWAVFEWAQASKTIKRPIRAGADRAEIRIDLGEFVATRIFTPKGTTLKIQSADGATYSSPQAFVDKLKGSLSFDPMAFTALSDKEQAETLRALVGIDTDALDSERAELYGTRADWNRQAKERAAAMVGHAGAECPKELPAEEISVAGLMAELETAEATKENQRSQRETLEYLNGAVLTLREGIKAKERDLAARIEEGRKMREIVDALTNPDTAEIKAQIAGADKTNKAIRDCKDYQSIKSQKIEAVNNADKLTKDIVTIDAKKLDLIQSAKFPISGLGFDDTGVTYQGQPFGQASSAEQLTVSMAMAMAMNPELRVIRITDGSLLDSTNLALIQEMAKSADYQVWIEKVDETGEIGVYIEDGRVGGAEEEEEKADAV
jgi:hypothetical protein